VIAPASLLTFSWRSALGVPAGYDESAHALPWLLELDVDGRALLVTNHAPSRAAWTVGPALLVSTFALCCAAAELERMHRDAFRGVLDDARRHGVKRARWNLCPACRVESGKACRGDRTHVARVWRWIADGPVYARGVELTPHDAPGAWSLEMVLWRIGAPLMRVAVIGGEETREAAE
jgi:hypothetical protein